VFPLAAKPAAFAGVSFPANTDEVRIVAATQDTNRTTRIIRSHDQRYGRIRVVGRRIVACCSLRGSDGSLVPKWPAALQAEYLAVNLGDAALNDQARQADRFEPVFQHFGAPPGWLFNDFLAFPNLDGDGNLITNVSPLDPQYQTLTARTLAWIPFRVGWSYTGQQPQDLGVGEARGAELMRPQAWVKGSDGRYAPADQAGFRVDALANEWGLSVNGTPNHVLARGTVGSISATAKEPLYDYRDMVMTLAFETDHRLELLYQAPNWRPSDGEIVVSTDGQLWFAAADTVVGVANDGTLQRTPTGAATVIRNDASRLYLTMAGAVARYAQQRARAEVVVEGLENHATMIGKILTVVEAGTSDAVQINAPVTGVEWSLGGGAGTSARGRSSGARPYTVLRAGFANQ
jgi:hypothetical protein